MLFTIHPKVMCQAAPAQDAADNVSVSLCRRPAFKWHHNDNFFRTIHGCFTNHACPVFHIMVGRICSNLVCNALNKGFPASTAKLGDVKRAATAFQVDDSFLFSCFWQANVSMHSVTNGGPGAKGVSSPSPGRCVRRI
jgi:hypothetical protein